VLCCWPLDEGAFVVPLDSTVIVFIAKYEERKTNKMQQLDVYY